MFTSTEKKPAGESSVLPPWPEVDQDREFTGMQQL